MQVIGITLGDVTGVGPEVAFKAVGRRIETEVAFVFIGDAATVETEAAKQGIKAEVQPWQNRRNARAGLWQINPVSHQESKSGTWRQGGPEAARAALASLRLGVELSLSGQLDGIVTAPLNKAAILRSGVPFVGQTEFVTGLAGSPDTGMMLLGTDEHGRWLRVLLATTHLPLAEVSKAISAAGLAQTIGLAERACRQLGLEQRRIALCGLNPHAGEGGYLGREEIEVIGPAIEASRKTNPTVSGPYPADSLFYRAIRGDYDVVVAMYHDQGLAPLKLVAFDTGVNWTVGLPFVRTSPDHGTAYEIAGQGIANAASMESAIHLALQLVAKNSNPEVTPG